MVEQRQLTSEEVDRLILESSSEESGWMKLMSGRLNQSPYEIFKNYSFVWDGVVIDGRPVYIAGVFKNGDRYELWTVVNQNVKEQISLFKCAKRGINSWIKDLPNIYATMKRSWVKNIEWTKRLGFKVCSETADTITFVRNKER